MAYRNNVNSLTRLVLLVFCLFSLLVLLAISSTRTSADLPNQGHRGQGPGRTERKPEVGKYSINHIPKFCSSLRSPHRHGRSLPILAPSVTGHELNEIGKNGALAQDDERIINYLWDHCDVFLRPPDGRESHFQGQNPSMGQDAVVRKLLGTVPANGFYVECGALDGVASSNTFQFEKEYGWKGLLLEPDPSNLRKLYGFHRNAWISHSCLSTARYPQEVIFKPSFDLGRIVEVVDPNVHNDNDQMMAGHPQATFNVQCFPLYSYLAALNVTTVDYFSLDIEGDELKVLKTIPFDKVLIKVISVEFLTSAEGEGPLKAFMESVDYITANKFYHGNTPFDLIFVHKSVNVPPSVLEELAQGM